MTVTTPLSPGMHGKQERCVWLAKKFPEKFLLPQVDLFHNNRNAYLLHAISPRSTQPVKII